MNVYELDKDWVVTPNKDPKIEGCVTVFVLSLPSEDGKGIVISMDDGGFVIERGVSDGRQISRLERAVVVDNTTQRVAITL